MNGWRYYNHALIPNVPPHKIPDLTEITNNAAFEWGSTLFVRWTSNFDCDVETNWWYVIKDQAFDISKLKAKRRYEVNKGIKNFDCCFVKPDDYMQELFDVTVAAFSAYPKKYRPSVEKHAFFEDLKSGDKTFFAAFDKQTGKMAAYAFLREYEEYASFSVLKSKPNFEKFGVNAALVNCVLEYYSARLQNGYYICDGERSIFHETAFQDYLEKYFGFRKAYCKLNIKYRPIVGLAVKILFPFRKIFEKLSGIYLFSQVYSIMKMEEIIRKQD